MTPTYRDMVETIARSVHDSAIKGGSQLTPGYLERQREEILWQFIGTLEDDITTELKGMKFDA